MKKIMLIILIAFNTNIFAEHYALINNSNYKEGVLYDENGFTAQGVHKETGTLYNPEGYDKEGFDESGFGEKVCNKIVGSFSIAHYGYNSNTKIYWDATFIGNFARASSYTLDNVLYTYDDSDTSGSYTGGYTHYAACRQESKD